MLSTLWATAWAARRGSVYNPKFCEYMWGNSSLAASEISVRWSEKRGSGIMSPSPLAFVFRLSLFLLSSPFLRVQIQTVCCVLARRAPDSSSSLRKAENNNNPVVPAPGIYTSNQRAGDKREEDVAVWLYWGVMTLATDLWSCQVRLMYCWEVEVRLVGLKKRKKKGSNDIKKSRKNGTSVNVI